MQLIQGKLDYSRPWTMPDIYCFTGNRIVKNDGGLVMGRGAARQIRDRYPDIDKAFGHAIRSATPGGRLTSIVIRDQQMLLWFQVKHHWADEADPTLISEAAQQLAEAAKLYPNNRFHLNAPGIGNGRLQWADVEPLLAVLPDNVLVYKI